MPESLKITIILIVVIIVVAGAIIKSIKKALRRTKDRFMCKTENVVIQQAGDILSPYTKEIAQGIVEAIKDDTPSIRSTGGATSIYLTKVRQDFKDFHAEDADTDIQTFILEFLQIKYGEKKEFKKARVSEKVLIPIGDKMSSTLSKIKINNIAISDYQKSLNSATLRYRVSIGFNVNGERKEKLYEVEYTLQLRDEYDSMAFLQCKNCGAAIKETDGICPYCGTKHIRDTISSWVVSDIKEK